MEDIERFLTRSPTPPVPIRNPNRRYSHWNFPPAMPNSSAKMIPKPLFSKRTGKPPMSLQIEVHDLRDWSSSASSQSSAPSSPTSSFRSFASCVSSVSSVTTVSTVSGPGMCETPKSHGYSFPPPDVDAWGNEWDPSHGPMPRLRRTKTPRTVTLRDLRAKGSDMCLQRVYEHQLELYLSGSLFPRTKWKDSLECLHEE